MAEQLAVGAVNLLLGVIKNESRLLGGVQGDVQFIQDEMESMNSYLLYLARNVPPSGEHDELVRTWMNQVRLLAVDCNNGIDLYLYRSNPDIHLPRGRLQYYSLWVFWYLSKVRAKRSAATKLRQLKERVRDVGQRRERYGVEVLAMDVKATGQSPSGAAGTSTTGGEGAGDEEQDDGNRPAEVFDFEPLSVEDYFEHKLVDWIDNVVPWLSLRTASIAIMAPETRQQDEACALARVVLDAKQVHHVTVDIPAVHDDLLPLQPEDILYYILRELQLEHARYKIQAQQQEATSSRGEGGSQHTPYFEEVEHHAASLRKELEHGRSQIQAQQQEATSSRGEGGSQHVPYFQEVEHHDASLRKELEYGRSQIQAQQQKATSSRGEEHAPYFVEVEHHAASLRKELEHGRSQIQAQQQEATSSRDEWGNQHATYFQEVEHHDASLRKELEHDRSQIQAQQQEATSSRGEVREQHATYFEEVEHHAASLHKELEHCRPQIQAQQHEATSSSEEEGQHAASHSKQRSSTLFLLRKWNSMHAVLPVQQQSEYQAQRKRKSNIFKKREKMYSKISNNIKQMEISEKFQNIIKTEIPQVIGGNQLQSYLGHMKDPRLQDKISKESLGALLLLLLKSSDAAAEQGEVGKKEAGRTLEAFYKKVIQATAMKLKEHLEAMKLKERLEGDAMKLPPISLSQEQYEDILKEVFPMIGARKDPGQDKMITMAALAEDQIKEIANTVKQEILTEVFPILMTSNSKTLQAQGQVQDSSAAKRATRTTVSTEVQLEIPQELKEEKSERKQSTGKVDSLAQAPHSIIKEIMDEKIESIKSKIEVLLKIKGIVDKIENFLMFDTLIILKVGQKMDGSLWEETRKALSLTTYVAGALIVTTQSAHQAKEYCCPQEVMQWEPIDFSVVGLYHATVLQFTSQNMQQENDIFRNILEHCNRHELCMKIFVCALYAKPIRSYEELSSLLSNLKADSTKSLGSIAQKMIKFSYNDLTKDYKSCLLSLAIFPKGHIIKRSTLIGRWVVDGLITTEKWSWPNSVDKAKHCFDTLIKRRFVYPADIGATGHAKSCKVDDLVHEFITTIAKKQNIIQIHLSDHLAHHFSISNNLRLRGSHTIEDFLKNPSQPSRLVLLRVLDLEHCRCFSGKKKRYLKYICCKILLLKYLSLRRTDVTQLPKQINNLHELEVFDIRNTKVTVSETKTLRLLKLKRLLAGCIYQSPSNPDNKELPSSVRVPDKIEKMLDIEVLSNVMALSNPDLRNIGTLCNLRKLGVVIEDNAAHLVGLLEAIRNMHDCLRSLSITILPKAEQESTPPSITTHDSDLGRRNKPRVLQSLSISGTTKKVQLLQELLEDGNQPSKVTLHSTRLNQGGMNILAKLPSLLCLRIRSKAYTESTLTFEKDEFKNLKFFHVEGSNMTDISFKDGAVPEIEKIVLSFTNNLKLSGVEKLTKLENLELNNISTTTTGSNSGTNSLPSIFNVAKQISKVTLRGTLLKEDDLRHFAKESNIRYLMLFDNSYVESKLNFNKDEFPKLNVLILSCSNINSLKFDSESAPRINKIVWSYKKMESLLGIEQLQRLRVIQFNGDLVPTEVKEAIKKHKNKPYFLHNEPGNQDQETGNTNEEDNNDIARFGFSWIKNKVCH